MEKIILVRKYYNVDAMGFRLSYCFKIMVANDVYRKVAKRLVCRVTAGIRCS